ncbi:MAG TPA: cupin domain-containing protein [Gemmatimonadaceae bacterium]|nr:cupin domain-containing protein [Gemmatimonadaceae bacterium]
MKKDVALVLLGAVIGIATDRIVFAQQPGIKRTELLRSEVPGDPAYEAVMAVAEIPAGAMAGRHKHNGIELGYVLQGSIELEHEGEATRVLKAGEGFKNAAGVHNARNKGKEPVKILAVYIVEKGKPLAEPVP